MKPSKRRVFSPILRKGLPKAFLPKPKPYGFVLGLDIQGGVVHNLHDPTGTYGMITSVQEHDGSLYLGTLSLDAIGRVPVPQSSSG